MQEARILTTPDLTLLAHKAAKTNKNRVPEDALLDRIDPEGIHVMGFSLVHNDCEMRTEWLVKVKNEDEPVVTWIDMEFEDFENLTKIEKTEEGEWVTA